MWDYRICRQRKTWSDESYVDYTYIACKVHYCNDDFPEGDNGVLRHEVLQFEPISDSLPLLVADIKDLHRALTKPFLDLDNNYTEIL